MSTTASAVRSAWANNLFNHASITALTNRIHDFDFESIADLSKYHDTLLRSAQEINFIQYQVRKEREYGITSKEIASFPVTVRYVKQHDIDGSNYNDIEAAFETLHTYIRSVLGDDWKATVDFYRPQAGPPSISEVELNGEKCWFGEYTYTGYKTESL